MEDEATSPKAIFNNDLGRIPEEIPMDCQIIPAVESAEHQMSYIGNSLNAFDGNVEYAWSDQMNSLPVVDDIDFVIDFAAATSSANFQAISPVSRGRSSIGSAATMSASLTESAMSNSRLSESTYVDGHGARRSVQEARQHDVTLRISVPLILEPGFPITTQVTEGLPESQFGNTQSLFATTYDTVVKQFRALYSQPPLLSTGPPPFPIFPSWSYCSFCFTAFQASFQENFSLIHCTAWQEQDDHWILVLAAITIGARHNHTDDGHQSRLAFEDFLRRAIRNAVDTGADCDPLPFAQACIILGITRFNSSSATLSESTLAEAHAACERFARQCRLPRWEDIDPSQVDLRWRAWIAQENYCRLLWCKWLLQAYMHLFRNVDSSISLPLEDYPLPSCEARWAARNAIDWARLAVPDQRTSTPMTALQPEGFRTALHILYSKNKLPEQTSTMSKDLLIYCLLAKTIEVARSVRDPLSSWNPGPPGGEGQSESESEDGEGYLQQSPRQWLPANSTFASWRNSACDCLDTIHWAANGDVALEKGYEKPIVFHLHLARILLLCPYVALIATGQRLSSTRRQNFEGFPVADLDRPILQSLTLDDHKVRLSLVHAGAIFWHCRRYSRGMFYEPFGIFVTALLIVIYGIYLPQVRGALAKIKLSVLQTRLARQTHTNGTEDTRPPSRESEEGELLPDSILLDRPCDDEMVQIFVRKGHEMNVKMSKAGDICLPSGQRIVLEEAIKLLSRSQYSHLADCQEYARTLRQFMHKL